MERFSKNELEKRVDEVLFYFWDPIGINEHIEARAEYRSYIPQILDRLGRITEVELAELLDSIVTSNMGFSPNKNISMKAARLLLEHKSCIDKGLA